MLELKQYSKKEISTILKSKTKQQIDRKLKGYEVEFESSGRGDTILYTINRLNDPFKVFCITDLGFTAQTDFKHLRHFMYHFFCDEVFINMPDEVKEHMMDGYDYHISRQTIAKYERKLLEKHYVAKGEYIYYFAYKGQQRIVTREEYRAAWHGYWTLKDMGAESLEAISDMIYHYGGVARKQAKLEKNIFYLNKINYLVELIGDSIEKDIK